MDSFGDDPVDERDYGPDIRPAQTIFGALIFMMIAYGVLLMIFA